jgi:hypothetical protein
MPLLSPATTNNYNNNIIITRSHQTIVHQIVFQYVSNSLNTGVSSSAQVQYQQSCRNIFATSTIAAKTTNKHKNNYSNLLQQCNYRSMSINLHNTHKPNVQQSINDTADHQLHNINTRSTTGQPKVLQQPKKTNNNNNHNNHNNQNHQ